MLSIRSLAILLLGSAALFNAGCKTFEEGIDQKVSVYSYPAGAEVSVNGEPVGTTPIDLELPRKINHQLRLDHSGYKTAEYLVAPMENERGKQFIRFGLLEDSGMYYDLAPDPIEIQLIPDILPSSRSYDEFSELSYLILQVDAERELGLISPVEHKYKVSKILEQYGL